MTILGSSAYTVNEVYRAFCIAYQNLPHNFEITNEYDTVIQSSKMCWLMETQ